MEGKASIDPAVACMLEFCEEEGISTSLSRANDMKPCPIGSGKSGICCKICAMGPCRLTKPDQVGLCGATADVIMARNLARSIAAGAAAHSDHGRDLALTLLAVAKGETPDYRIRDTQKLMNVAQLLGVRTEGRAVNEIAEDVANRAISAFGQQRGEIPYISRAPKKRQEIWRKLGIVPRGIDREIVETLHRTHAGNDQDAEHIMRHALRTALSDGWGGSMLATDISDILFGTPTPILAKTNLGALSKDEVNIVVHGHEPTLSEMILTAVSMPEMIEYAKSKGAQGINLTGICCTANELLMRQGIATIGNFLSQELALMTGSIEAMVVDIQCIMEALAPLAERFHTHLITTSPKAKIKGAKHIEFDEHHALDIAKEIVRMAIDNYPNRPQTNIPDVLNNMVAGFSHEYVNYMQGGLFRGSFRPLNDAIIAGRIRGAAGVVGCNNARVCQDQAHTDVVRELIKNDVLVVMTGCGAIACSKFGLLLPEMMEHAGKGLREVCEAIGIPPVLHMGSCVDNTRILTVLTQMANEGGLGEDIADLPGVGIAPEWMSEKALSIGTYFVASGVYTIFGVTSPVASNPEFAELISKGWEAQVGGKLEFEPDPAKIVEKALAHIDAKRAALGLAEYDPNRFGKSGDWNIEKWLEMPAEERPAGARSLAEIEAD